MNLFKKSPTPPHEAPIDREGRDRMADALEGLLKHRTSGEAFDELLTDIEAETEDPTVHFVCDELGLFYDDIDELTAVKSKNDWDHIHRLLLLLQTDGHIVIERRTRYSFSQVLAAASLAFVIILVAWRGFDGAAIAYFFSMVAFSILFLWSLRETQADPKHMAMTPFASLPELIQARRKVPDFRKKKYPGELKPDGIFSNIFDWAMYTLYGGFALYVSPMVLPYYLFPSRETKTRVVFPA